MAVCSNSFYFAPHSHSLALSPFSQEPDNEKTNNGIHYKVHLHFMCGESSSLVNAFCCHSVTMGEGGSRLRSQLPHRPSSICSATLARAFLPPIYFFSRSSPPFHRFFAPMEWPTLDGMACPVRSCLWGALGRLSSCLGDQTKAGRGYLSGSV